MKNKKTFVVLITIFIIYFIVMCVILSKYKPFKGYIVVDNIGCYKCSNEKCNSVDNTYIESQKFNVFKKSDEKLLSNMRLEYVNSWNLFDENNNWYSLDSMFVGYSTDFELSKLQVIERNMYNSEVSDYDMFLDNKGLFYDKLFTSRDYLFSQKNVDYKISYVSNYDMDNAVDDKIFTVIDLYINNKKESLVYDVEDNKNIYGIPKYNVFDISLLNGDIVLIITKNYFDNFGTSTANIYKIVKNKLFMLA